MLTISESRGSKAVGGDSGNTFLRTPALEKACAVYGEEFGERMGCAVEVIQSLHGVATASRSFSLFLGDFVRTLGRAPPRADLGA